MWDTVPEYRDHVSHERPCADCGHSEHIYLPCSDACRCVPSLLGVLTGPRPSVPVWG